MSEPISEFRGEFCWLSNFHLSPILLDGVPFNSVEGAYQAAKTDVPEEREKIRQSSPGRAKRLGRTVTLRASWFDVSLRIMEQLLREKFSDPSLKELLLETGDRELIEGNYWHDNFWGQCSCAKHVGKGENHLGKILMKLRGELKNGRTS